ncbi:MAG TPA: VanZ family protein [Gemmataceae bacterium]|jgi:VanZ family protein|nr:VanZ family protein [Gemmataceae bacterium]
MTSRTVPVVDRSRALGLWLFWVICVAVWTTALLTLFPVEISRQVLPENLRFPTAKTLHVSAYAFLAFLTVLLPARGRVRWLLIAFLSLHAFATEYLQTFIGRGGALADVGLDHIGILLGLLIGWRWWREPGLARGEQEHNES